MIAPAAVKPEMSPVRTDCSSDRDMPPKAVLEGGTLTNRVSEVADDVVSVLTPKDREERDGVEITLVLL